MTILGHFQLVDGTFKGSINSLLFQADIVVTPVTADAHANAPDYHVFCGERRIGAAWKKDGDNDANSLSVSIDDPCFPRPIRARLSRSAQETDNNWTLFWLRHSQKSKG